MGEQPYRSGMVALIGKPNVGKSTLLNTIVGQKVSIVSNKPQTTRRRILGIATTDAYQIVFIDTPGIHEPHTRLQKSMVEHSRAALSDVDLIVLVVDAAHHPGDDDKQIAKMVREAGSTPVVLCMNKMDQLKAENVQAFVDAYCHLAGTEEYMLTTATRGLNVDKLVDMIVAHLPEGEAIFPEDEFTDQSSRFLVGELIREKILKETRQEVPHATAVLVDEWEEDEVTGLLHIGASIYAEKASQKGILIGKQGQFLKKIGTEARKEIEELLGRKVYLELNVKVREDWRMNPRMLQELEYSD
ncbi:MAG TPA: GTPase Era [Fimbriimonadaceae bacterium]|nr:GTPase Era [Fimbriimonadaceae bacterium]